MLAYLVSVACIVVAIDAIVALVVGASSRDVSPRGPVIFASIVVIAIIGGASLFGAKGGAFGAAAGALIVGTLNNGGNLLGINAFYLTIIIGVLILVAVFFDQWQGKLAARR